MQAATIGISYNPLNPSLTYAFRLRLNPTMTKTSILVLAGSVALTSARCFEPEPAFPVPQWQKVRATCIMHYRYTMLKLKDHSRGHGFLLLHTLRSQGR